jgi:tetratricopeptide (TPR) repeat protein
VSDKQYKAFISYSHRDERWARWLQRSLERYRVPGRLAGKEGAHGTVPARLRPVFRDREDLSSAADLTARIKEEIVNSEFLIVVCSPAAAASRWVNEEIRHFRDQVGADRILALIVDGDPQADSDNGGCFPEALLESPDGSRREPLAADVRRYSDGKHLSLLKIIAGLLGIRLDELRRREAHRLLQKRLVWGTATVVLVSVLGWLLYTQAASRAAAQVQRANTEELLSYMLGDLQRLDSVAGVESMVVEQEEHVLQSRQLGLADLDSEALLEKAMEWRKAGLGFNWEGKLDAAMEQFRSSYTALVELHRREGNTDRVLFELGQAEFYVGEVFVQMGEPETTREHWIRYGALTRRLLNREPNNPTYVMELSYTLMNLGALEHVSPVPDTEKSLELLQAGLQYNQMALVLDPGNPEYLDSLPTQQAWLADTWIMKCSLGEALETRQEAADFRRTQAEQDPGSARAQQLLAYALTGLAGVQQQIGLHQEAVASFEEAVSILHTMHDAEPGNEEIESEMLYRESRLARLLISMGDLERAAAIIEPIAGRIAELGGKAENLDLLRSVEAAQSGLDYSRILLAKGETEAGEQVMRSSVSLLAELVREKPGAREGIVALAWAAFAYWEQFGTHPPDAAGLLPDDFLPGPGAVESCSTANLGARLAVSEGDQASAKQFVDYALSKGYFEADFITFCKRYGLCELP